MKPLAFTVVIFLTAQAIAVEPRAVISGPQTAKIGTLVVLSSAGSVSDPGGLAWVFIDGKTQALEGLNNELGFVQGEAGRVIVGLVAVGLVDGRPKVSLAKHVVDVGTVPPNPGPTPPGPQPNPPTPGPMPDLPPGRFGLAKFSYDAAMRVAQPARAKAPNVAAAFGSVASAVAAKQILDKPTAGLACKAELAKAIGTDAAAWKECRDAVVGEFNRLEAAKQIVTVDDLAAAFLEIELGIKQAK